LEAALRGQSDIQSAFFESWPQDWDVPEQLEILMDMPDLDALVVGALRSDYQKTRVDRMCERLGIISYSPLWHHGSHEHMHALVDHGFDARIASVSSEGLGEDWLGRRVDNESLTALEVLAEKHRFNLDGEGGEFETVVLAAPHMRARIECSAESLWDGTRGVWNIESASLSSMR
jgi:predicted ATP pyrophosphatase (TIGR00289 family)